jgi:hypothetical protein
MYCHVPGVVWLITRRGFGLDTGFIHYGDLQLLQVTLTETTIALVASRISLTELHCADVSLRTLTASTDWLQRLTYSSRTELTTHTLWLRRLTNCCVLSSIYNIVLSQWKHWPSHCWLPCNQHWPFYCWLHATQQYRIGDRIHGSIAVA